MFLDQCDKLLPFLGFGIDLFELVDFTVVVMVGYNYLVLTKTFVLSFGHFQAQEWNKL